MALVRPFRAWTYTRSGTDVTPLVAPPYDVISPTQREDLLSRSPHNVVALELPEGDLDPTVAGNRYETGAARWRAWTEDGTLTRDEEPTLYVLEQHYRLGDREIRRRAFIAEVKLCAFDECVVLPHERTLPKALGDRYALLEATGANLSQVFGLFPDPERATDAAFAAATSSAPVMTATDDDGVVSTLWAVTDGDLIASVTETLADKQVFIADGHHRYTTALAYRDARREADASIGSQPADPDYNYVMMALVNMDDPDLVVLPTHRVADAPETFDAEEFYSKLATHFDVSELPSGHPAGALDDTDGPAFLVKTSADERPLLAVLRPDVDLAQAIPLDHTQAWKELDVTVLLELILNPLLDIHPDRPATLSRLRFVKDAHDALAMTAEHDAVFILRSTRMDQMRAVSLAGEV
ncbi:MAG: DUF1015 domain-containing protein, partial [Coriobacteriia bacterium]|nr:DUF1015 domain-containing protein [Coriobacteriia bacterium]